MKKMIVIIVLLFAGAAVAATEPVTEEKQDRAQEDKAKPAGEVAQPAPERDKEWPRPFVPSEQIGADTVVTFPADI